MSKKGLPIAAVVTGFILAALSATADMLGIGGEAVFGWKQTVGIIVGVVLIILGAVSLTGGPEEEDDKEPT